MILHLIRSNSDLKWKDKKGIQWNYVSKSELDKKTGGKIFLFGDIGKKGNDQRDRLIDEQGNRVPVYAPRETIGFFEKVRGYIECKEESKETSGFVRIVEVAKGKVIAIFFILLLLLGGIGFMMTNQGNAPEIDKAAVSYEMPGGIKNTDPDMIAMPGISEIVYKKSEKKGISPLINPEGNVCYFQYKIVLRETGEVIYQSKNIKPGMALVDYSLSKDLEVGEYAVSLSAEATDLENPDQVYNTGQINAVLKVVE